MRVIDAFDRSASAHAAMVELKSGAYAAESELIALCKSRLGSVKTPKVVQFWPALPHSCVGKALKHTIHEHCRSRQQRKISL